LRPLIVENVSRKSTLMTDEGGQYYHVGKEFDRHEMINHSADEIRARRCLYQYRRVPVQSHEAGGLRHSSFDQ
jgi:hypothetical protein